MLGKISFSLNRKTVEIQTFSSHAAFSHGFPQVRRPVLEHAPYWNPCRSPRKTGKKFKILFPNSEKSPKSTNPKILQNNTSQFPIQVFPHKLYQNTPRKDPKKFKIIYDFHFSILHILDLLVIHPKETIQDLRAVKDALKASFVR